MGSTIVFFTAGVPSKRFTFERAAELGVKSVIIDHPDSWSKKLVDEGVIAKFIGIDMSLSSDEIFEQARAAINGLGQDGKTGAADAIASFVELSVPTVARLCEALGLPGHHPQAVDMARNKHSTRAALKAHNLPTPRTFLISSEAEVNEAAAKVGFPSVLKPVSGAASLGVKKVTSQAELLQCYREVVTELSSLVVSSGALIKRDPNDAAGVDACSAVDLTVLMEQYLDGCEVDVDVVMSNGEYVYAAVADNGPTLEPYFNETWGLCPSAMPKEQQRALKALAVDCVKALGFAAGVFHVECKMTSTGPQLIEVNARMGGGQIHECNLIVWGVDLVEETLFAALGIPARPNVPREPKQSVAYCYVNAARSGIVKDMSKLDEIRTRSGVVWAKPLTKVGNEAVGVKEGLPTWLCDLMVTKPKPKDALAMLQAIEAEVPVIVS
jgi:carnosine synthase